MYPRDLKRLKIHIIPLKGVPKNGGHTELLGILSQSEGRDTRATYSIRLVNMPVPKGENRIIVGHGSNIRESTGHLISEGEAVVVRPGAEQPEILAILSPEDWDKLN